MGIIRDDVRADRIGSCERQRVVISSVANESECTPFISTPAVVVGERAWRSGLAGYGGVASSGNSRRC